MGQRDQGGRYQAPVSRARMCVTGGPSEIGNLQQLAVADPGFGEVSFGLARRGGWHSSGSLEIGPDLFRAACDMMLEGLVSKRRDSRYRAGPSRDWVKVKNPKSPAMNRAKDAFA